MSNIVDLYAWRKSQSERECVTYTIHVTQHADGELETYVEDVDDDPDTDKVMHLLELLVNSHKLRKYAEYIADNLPEIFDDEGEQHE
jgi:Tol biopolymer transport system component